MIPVVCWFGVPFLYKMPPPTELYSVRHFVQMSTIGGLGFFFVSNSEGEKGLVDMNNNFDTIIP